MCEQELDKSCQRGHDAVHQSMCGSKCQNLLLAELWLRLESCQLVGLPATLNISDVDVYMCQRCA